MNSENPDRRKEERLPVRLNAFLHYEIVDLENLSLNGMKIKSEAPIPISKSIPIFVFMPENKIMKLNGDVLWSNKLGETEFNNGIQINSSPESSGNDFLSLLSEEK